MSKILHETSIADLISFPHGARRRARIYLGLYVRITLILTYYTAYQCLHCAIIGTRDELKLGVVN